MVEAGGLYADGNRIPRQSRTRALALQFSKLWETGPPCPTCSLFSLPIPIADDERLDVLLVDQRERWLRG